MAAGDVTNQRVISFGGKRISVGQVEHGTSADYTFHTGLSVVENMTICWVTDSSADEHNSFVGYRNSNTTTENVAGYGGMMNMDGDITSSWGDNGELYWYKAIGV